MRERLRFRRPTLFDFGEIEGDDEDFRQDEKFGIPIFTVEELTSYIKGLLDADPTLQYIIPDGPRRLLNADKLIDSPYNTYLNRGLPPGPINNPGRQSILAAIFPDDVDYLYFVAQGDGYHAFSTTYSNHLKAQSRISELMSNGCVGLRVFQFRNFQALQDHF